MRIDIKGLNSQDIYFSYKYIVKILPKLVNSNFIVKTLTYITKSYIVGSFLDVTFF